MGHYVNISLGAAALSALTAEEGMPFVFGGATTPANGGQIFGYNSNIAEPSYLILDVAEVGSTAVPEPASLALLGLGLLAVGTARRRRGR